MPGASLLSVAVLEHAPLQVRPGLAAAFEVAREEALPLPRRPGSALLHPFADPHPVVEHHVPVAGADPRPPAGTGVRE